MHCDRVRELLSPYLDEALPAPDRSMLAAHLESCQDCARFAADLRRLARTLSALWARAYAHVPDVAAAARAGWRAGTRLGAVGARALLAARPGGGPRVARRAAPIMAACALTAVATWWHLSSAEPDARFEHDVLAAHMRALLQESPTQVASADTHWIKPWFSGRVDFSPSVADLSAEGFSAARSPARLRRRPARRCARIPAPAA